MIQCFGQLARRPVLGRTLCTTLVIAFGCHLFCSLAAAQSQNQNQQQTPIGQPMFRKPTPIYEPPKPFVPKVQDFAAELAVKAADRARVAAEQALKRMQQAVESRWRSLYAATAARLRPFVATSWNGGRPWGSGNSYAKSFVQTIIDAQAVPPIRFRYVPMPKYSIAPPGGRMPDA